MLRKSSIHGYFTYDGTLPFDGAAARRAQREELLKLFAHVATSRKNETSKPSAANNVRTPK